MSVAPQRGEPPIIKADNSPTKIVPAPSDAVSKMPDRMTAGGDGAEKIVPREETPVDVNARSGPRVVFPPLNQNANPPSVASVAPSAPLPPAAPPTARCRTTSRARSRRCPSRAIQPPQACRQRRRLPPAKPATRPAATARRGSGAARQSLRQPMPAPTRPCRWRRSAPQPDRGRRPGSPPPIRPPAASAGGRLSGSGLLARSRGRRAGLLPGAAGQVSQRARLASAGDQARRPRRQGRLLPRHGRSVRFA